MSEADLQRLATVADRAAGALKPPTPPPTPPPQQAAAAPPEPAPPEPAPPEPPPPEPQAQPKAEPPPQQTAALPAEPPPSAPPDQPALLPEPALEQLLKIPAQVAVPHSLDPPKPPEPAAKPAKPEEAARPPQPKQRLRTSALDLTLPPSVFTGPSGGGGAGVQRPPGITRSGENDAFARGVIAALQRTMPQMRDTRGRVTVRIKLDKDGSLVRTDVIGPSSVSGLDQNVVFATRQASFPFPPRNANDADLTFLVTYIYR